MPNEREEAQRGLAALRATLGDVAFDSAWSAGRALTWEQAIEYALETDPPRETGPEHLEQNAP